MDEQLSAIIRSLRQPNLFPLRKSEHNEMSQMESYVIEAGGCLSRFFVSLSKRKAAPKALLIHGWGGNPFMLTPQKAILQQLGFDIYLPFLSGHDLDYPTPCSVPDQIQLLLKLQQQMGEFDVVIAHSAGGVIAALAATQGFMLHQLILLASPRSFPALLDYKLNEKMPFPGLRAALHDTFFRHYGAIPALMSETLFSALDAHVLVLHGTADCKIPCQDAESIHLQLARNSMLLIDDTGHLGLLQHQATRQAVSDYLRPWALPIQGATDDALSH